MTDQDTAIQLTAFEHLRRLSEVRAHLTAAQLTPGFTFNGERIPLINPQRGIFKPRAKIQKPPTIDGSGKRS
jgi:putative restriction endonuclease